MKMGRTEIESNRVNLLKREQTKCDLQENTFTAIKNRGILLGFNVQVKNLKSCHFSDSMVETNRNYIMLMKDFKIEKAKGQNF